MPLRIYPGGIKTRVAWHQVPGKKKKDASSPVGTVDQCFLQMCHTPFLGLIEQQTIIMFYYSGDSSTITAMGNTFSCLIFRLVPPGQHPLFHCRIFLKLTLMGSLTCVGPMSYEKVDIGRRLLKGRCLQHPQTKNPPGSRRTGLSDLELAGKILVIHAAHSAHATRAACRRRLILLGKLGHERFSGEQETGDRRGIL